jgi:hypothetical protein
MLNEGVLALGHLVEPGAWDGAALKPSARDYLHEAPSLALL